MRPRFVLKPGDRALSKVEFPRDELATGAQVIEYGGFVALLVWFASGKVQLFRLPSLDRLRDLTELISSHV